MRQRGLWALELNEARGFVGQNLNFLRDLPDLVELGVVHHQLDDDRGVEHCTNLRILRLDTYCDTSPDFSLFSQLVDCYIDWRDAASSLINVRTLQRLHVEGPPWADLHPLQALTSLTSLLLDNARRLESLTGVQSLTSLERLSIYRAPRLPSLSGIEALPSLRTLELDVCRKLTSLEPVRPLQQLERLHFLDAGSVDSLDPVRNLVNLQELWLGGSTNVKDGQFRFLLDLPALREVRFANRRHYDEKYEAMTAALQVRASRS